MAGAYTPRNQQKVATFEIAYDAGVGGAPITLDVISGENIADWSHVNRDLPKADGLTCIIEWVNPKPARIITGIDFRSTGVGVPILIAVTGEEIK